MKHSLRCWIVMALARRRVCTCGVSKPPSRSRERRRLRRRFAASALVLLTVSCGGRSPCPVSPAKADGPPPSSQQCRVTK